MRTLAIMCAGLMLFAFLSTAMAVPPGKTVEYAGGGHGKVIFDGKLHHDKGFQCANCHTKIFPMKRGSAKITLSEMSMGKFCGECHNGTQAFKVNEPLNCSMCHKE